MNELNTYTDVFQKQGLKTKTQLEHEDLKEWYVLELREFIDKCNERSVLTIKQEN